MKCVYGKEKGCVAGDICGIDGTRVFVSTPTEKTIKWSEGFEGIVDPVPQDLTTGNLIFNPTYEFLNWIAKNYKVSIKLNRVEMEGTEISVHSPITGRTAKRMLRIGDEDGIVKTMVDLVKEVIGQNEQ